MSRRMWLAGAIVAAVIFLSTTGARWYTDYLWFESLGYESVFVTALLSRLALFAVAWVVGSLSLWIGWRLALGRQPAAVTVIPRGIGPRVPVRSLGGIVALVALVIGLVLAYGQSTAWFTLRLALTGGQFGLVDPLFGADVGRYVFWLPVYEQLLGFAGALLGLISVGGVAILVVSGALELAAGWFGLARRSRGWVAGVIAAWLLLRAAGYKVQMMRLLMSPSGTVFGAGYADVHARLPGLWILLALCLLGAVVTVALPRRRGLWPLVVPVIVVMTASFLVGTVYPGIVQQFRVSPNELAMERPYIEHNIRFTREAYGLNEVRSEPYPIKETLTQAQIHEHRDTFDNIRLWDWRPLLSTFRQLQEIRLYYRFADVDIDRYLIDGRLRQVMLSARELDAGQLPAEARSWVNLRLKFTHGYGAVAAPPNEFGRDGLPNLWLKDLPPESAYPELQVSRPEIYFGELSHDYVIVNTKEPEFSYPQGDQNVYAHYEGRGGVRIDSGLKKMAFAARFQSYRILLTDSIHDDSRIMYYRSIAPRVSKLAPFLSLDDDPYLVVAEGRLYWIIDAYTTSDRFPYSRPYKGRFNYLRNPVKVVVDAYDGDVTLFIVEPEPIINAMASIFPDLFASREELPAALKSHLRIPETRYTVMADKLTLYHMQDPAVFYNREDLWRVPSELYHGRERTMEPYYQIMRLPEGTGPEFVLVLPFTPAGRDNMIALLAARCDPDHYGDFVLYRLPKEELVYGPMQIEARISQDAEISQKLTLWGQSGSEVIRGNLLVLPIENSIMYVEPLYLQSTETKLPELKRVIGSWGGRVAMAESVADLLRMLLQVEIPEDEGRVEPDTAKAVAALVTRAVSLLERADERMRAGDWAGYGQMMSELKSVISELERRLGE